MGNPNLAPKISSRIPVRGFLQPELITTRSSCWSLFLVSFWTRKSSARLNELSLTKKLATRKDFNLFSGKKHSTSIQVSNNFKGLKRHPSSPVTPESKYFSLQPCIHVNPRNKFFGSSRFNGTEANLNSVTTVEGIHSIFKGTY
ncbi:hypothetical protein CDAR_315131 [Caerostris darwini]|uniref:Uncharacterized protein n=1 Tax=Caerostris darwini TaxID=1538125 RepID=A0AAV4TV01_9ARAC|nr:hypothetical protein CDAR_315131 [Caerostris darwini]